jgi:capsular polysaccharide transport system permease protein
VSAPKLIATDSAQPAKPAPKPAAAAEPPADPKVPQSAIALRTARRRILQRRFGIWVGLPTLIAIVYYLFVATPQYDAHLVLAVESSEGRINVDTSSKGNAGNQRDARLLREALRGAPALEALDRDGAFRSHYRNGGDWFSRLGADAGPDTTVEYFRDKVSIAHEANTNVLTVRMRAFSGEAAHGFAAKLVEFAKTWVAHQNATASTARLELAQAEVARERAKLTAAASALAQAGSGSDQPRPTDPVAIEHQVALKRLEVALGGVQDALHEVGRTQRYLVVLDGPSHPDTAALPRRAWGILSVCISALVLVAVLSLLGASVREHAKF